MRPESRKYLWDAREAAQRLQTFTAGQSLDDYLRSALLRSAVERQYEIIGEALRQLGRADPETAAMVPELSRIVAFRNILIHGYATVDDRLVWGLLESKLPTLATALDLLLAGP